MKRFFNTRGQVFILAAFIALILLTTIPLIVFLTQTYSSHQVNQLKKSQSLAIAEAGISYASHELMNSLAGNAVWNSALGNNFGAAFGSPDCNTANPVTIAGVGSVKLTCLTSASPQAAALAPDLEPYQVAVIATTYLPAGRNSTTLVSTRAMEAYLSQRTMGVTLPNGTQAGAALQLTRVPTSNPATQAFLGANALTVHWGPIVDYQLAPTAVPPLVLAPAVDSTTWQLATPLDTTPGTVCPNPLGGTEVCPGYPRIFSNGGLTGTGVPPNYLRAPGQAQTIITDNYQWWAYSSLLAPPNLHLAPLPLPGPPVDPNPNQSYQSIAEAQTVGTPGYVTIIAANCPNARVGNHVTATGPCSLQGATNLVSPASTVLFIDGNDVTISGVQLTVGALIVMKNLTVNAPLVGAPRMLTVPTSAYKEYMAITSAQTNGAYTWPCGNNTTTPTPQVKQCLSTALAGAVNFTGFLYVAGNMTVNAGASWIMSGALAVGDMTYQYLATDPITGLPEPETGQLVIPAGNQLILFYDAAIEHNIQVLSNELEIDRMQAATPQ